ncbi:sensor histidine kinase [Sphingomonas ginkgonis]|uniref:histidine kinase n=1 Tax=Sphingomonas ginkgonis TaxID=2315330 RepID=A0A429V8L7_9SPHN|nr:PAS domain-containing sensor histidine kinase [Sphingomonas ginkgonis]RST30323.1 sensor histidine kinase [Sphingomonas ginkgonis]
MSFLNNGGKMGATIRSRDWSSDPLGPPEKWPAALKTSLGLILGSHFPQCVVWGDGLVTFPNDAYLPILGNKPDALGRRFDEIWSEVWPSLAPLVCEAFAGCANYIEDWPLTIERNGPPEQVWFTFCFSPIRDETGKVVGMLDIVTETTAQVLLHDRQRLLAGELNHRLKNLLTIIQAVVNQTLRRATDLGTANVNLSQRLAAIGRAADVLTAAEWEEAPIRDLVRNAVATSSGIDSRFRLSGPAICIKPLPALALTLALHELVTNAMKHGALSNDSGTVDLSWSLLANGEVDPHFTMAWQEHGGPPVRPPTRRGFGTLMIERSLRAYFPDGVWTRYEPDGLVFTIDSPFPGARLAAEPVTSDEAPTPRS